MRRYTPSLLVVNFSDVEVAHFGSYSMYLAGIRNTDRLIYELWQEVGANSEYRDRTLMVIVPEFGRDPDGSNTNGFFNHRSNDETCRRIWTMCLGKSIPRPQIVDRPVRLVDLCPSLARWLGCKATESTGGSLAEIST
jgi:arylsulfatase A-like enzyme